MSCWGTSVERERRRRIRLSIAAYAYECEAHSIMSDATFDRLSRMIEPELRTGVPLLDRFFRAEFSPDTGMWIHQHPELDGIRHLYWKYFGHDNPGRSRRQRKKHAARRARRALSRRRDEA